MRLWRCTTIIRFAPPSRRPYLSPGIWPRPQAVGDVCTFFAVNGNVRFVSSSFGRIGDAYVKTTYCIATATRPIQSRGGSTTMRGRKSVGEASIAMKLWTMAFALAAMPPLCGRPVFGSVPGAVQKVRAVVAPALPLIEPVASRVWKLMTSVPLLGARRCVPSKNTDSSEQWSRLLGWILLHADCAGWRDESDHSERPEPGTRQRPRIISRVSQVLAKAQSLWTRFGEMLRIEAISSAVRPLKYRISTT